MDASSILSGSDNLFKYLFSVGAIMIVVSISYPLQKSQEIDLERLVYNEQVSLLNNDIALLNKEISTARSNIDGITTAITRKEVVDSNKLKIEALDIVKEIKKKANEIEIKNILSVSNKTRVLLLEKHSADYRFYYNTLFWGGVAFLLFGLTGWLMITFLKEEEKLSSFMSRKSKDDAKSPSIDNDLGSIENPKSD